MSTLSYQTIKRLCFEKNLIYPFSEKQIFNGMTFGFSQNGYDIRIAQTVILYPVTLKNLIIKSLGFKRPSFSLANSIENFKIPNNLRFTVADKSSWARKGLAVQNTIGEAGWSPTDESFGQNSLTLELTNHGDSILVIPAGSPIAQVLFETLDEETFLPYRGKYSGQPSTPVPAIFEK